MKGENAPHRLLVEGRDDKHSILHLMARHGACWDDGLDALPYIHDCDGITNLLPLIPVSAKSYRRLGIVIDANADLESRWNQLRDKMESIGLSVPASPDPLGTTLQGIFPDWKVGVWLMPDNNAHGELEHFLQTLVPPEDPCWKYAQEATEHAREIGASFPDKKSVKARIHAWLSWQENPGLPFGTAITAAYLSHDSPEATKFVAWFNKLFLENG